MPKNFGPTIRHRTIADELRDKEIARETAIEKIRYGDKDPTIRYEADISYRIIGEGTARRSPVRYE